MTKAIFLTSFSTLANSFLLKYFSMFCYYEKQMLSVLGIVLYELDANKKCQVSLVVKYMNWHSAVHRKLMPISLDISQNLVIQGQTLHN